MSASQRRKGAQWERTLAKRWRDSGLYPDAWRGAGQSRRGSDVPDVDGTPWWVECKVGARPNVLAALAQAEGATDGRPPLVVAKRDREAPVVCMRLDDFEVLLCLAALGVDNERDVA